MMARRLAVIVACLVGMSTPALAHLPIDGVGGLSGGLLHPILVPAHALSVVSLGLFIGQLRDPSFNLLIFAGALAVGLFAISLAIGATPAAIILLAITAVFGLSVAAARVPPRLIAASLIGGAGLALGLDSPPQAVTLAEGNALLAGTEIGACLAVLAVAICSRNAVRGLARLGVRILGSWIAASAMLVLAVAIAR